MSRVRFCVTACTGNTKKKTGNCWPVAHWNKVEWNEMWTVRERQLHAQEFQYVAVCETVLCSISSFSFWFGWLKFYSYNFHWIFLFIGLICIWNCVSVLSFFCWFLLFVLFLSVDMWQIYFNVSIEQATEPNSIIVNAFQTVSVFWYFWFLLRLSGVSCANKKNKIKNEPMKKNGFFVFCRQTSRSSIGKTGMFPIYRE